MKAILQATYQKLGYLPLRLSEVFVAESTARLQSLYPAGAHVALPPSLWSLTVVVVEARRSSGSQAAQGGAGLSRRGIGRQGGVLGGKALVAVGYVL